MKDVYKHVLNPKGKLGIWGIVALIILGVFLIVFPGMFLSKKEKVSPLEILKESPEMFENSSSLNSMENTLARQATNILGQIEGVGQVAVAVSLAGGPEQDYAKNMINQKSVVEDKAIDSGVRVTTEVDEKIEYILVQGRNEPLLLKEKSAQIKGVLVVAEGAKNAIVKTQLTRAVQSLFDLPIHRIIILPKKGG